MILHQLPNFSNVIFFSIEGEEKIRGKNPEQYHNMIKHLYPEIQKEEILKLMADAVPQDLKCADSDTEAKLERVDWKNDKIILFVFQDRGALSYYGIVLDFYLLSFLRLRLKKRLHC